MALTPRQQAVYDLLFAAAETGEPCPTNAEIVRALGIVGDSLASDAIGVLDRLGMIRRHNQTGGRREVEIVATGKVTRTQCRTTAVSVPETANRWSEADRKFADALRGQVFTDHPKAKPTKRPVFVPARGEAWVLREANC